MKVKGQEWLEEKHPGRFNVERKPKERPPRIEVTRVDGEPFSYYVATDSSSGLSHRGERTVGQRLVLGPGDRALISPRPDRESVLEDSVEIMVDL